MLLSSWPVLPVQKNTGLKKQTAKLQGGFSRYVSKIRLM
jgi:hypothetical protein